MSIRLPRGGFIGLNRYHGDRHISHPLTAILTDNPHLLGHIIFNYSWILMETLRMPSRICRPLQRFTRAILTLTIALALTIALGSSVPSCAHPNDPTPDEMAERDRFVAASLSGTAQPTPPEVVVEAQPYDSNIVHGTSGHGLKKNVMWDDRPMKIGRREYTSGLSIHAPARIIIRLPMPGQKFSAVIGIDRNASMPGQGSVVFKVLVADQEVFRSSVLRGADPGKKIDVELDGARQFVLEVEDAGDGIAFDTADWADARVTLQDGTVLFLGGAQSGNFNTALPFSFDYDGKPSTELLAEWNVDRAERKLDDRRTERVAVYTDPKTGLEVRCEAIVYHDYPTVEWTVYFNNRGSQATPILANIQGIDTMFTRGQSGEFTLHYQEGSTASPSEYQPLVKVLDAGASIKLAPTGGRATSEYLPYFNLQWHGAGAIVALGWPGQWEATFQPHGARTIKVTGGQQSTHMSLQPGEQIRTPLTVVQFWRGNTVRAQNIWRRWMVAHNLPRPGGKLPAPQWSATSAAQLAEMMMANEENQIEFINRYLDHDLKIDFWWMDYAWFYYQGDDIRYETDLGRFPRGLRAITDHARSRGVRSMVWFEPENRSASHRIWQQHPEWMLADGNWGLVDLGKPEALSWITDMVHGQLEKEGIDFYRSDYNTEPLRFWRKQDASDRQGMTENKYITGYLAFWDELLRRDPDRMIDACSSGGRRNDLETMRRSVPLWRSDYNNVAYVVFNYRIAPRHHLAKTLQNHTYGLSRWLPYFGTAARDDDLYIFRSGMCPAIVSAWDVRRNDIDFALLRRMTGQWRDVADYYLGDYYPLTPYSRSEEVWMAWQFDRPDLSGGLVQAFRRAASPMSAATFKLSGLVPDASYDVIDLDTDQSLTLTGAQLMDPGLPVAIENRSAAALVRYEKLDH